MKLCPSCTTQNLDEATECVRCHESFPLRKREYDYPRDHIRKLEDHPADWLAKLGVGLAVVSMLSLFLIPMCTPIPGLLSLVAGHRVQRNLKSRYSSKGETYANIAVWCGWISTSVGLLLLVLGISVTVWFVQWFRDVFSY